MSNAVFTTVRTIAELRSIMERARASGARIGLVPTMGAFHEGHVALMREARGACDVVVVSLFVNPTQFGDASDLEAYPRDESRDAMVARDAGVDVLFAPPLHEVYPQGFSTTIHIGGVTAPLEGQARGPLHFQGVATVVTKLFNIVQPHSAYFGQKDVQQTRVIHRLVRDLNIPIEIVVCPTVRERDGLAMSSRNVRLTPEARLLAPALYEALQLVTSAVTRGERSVALIIAAGTDHLMSRGIRPSDIEYFAAANSETLEPQETIQSETVIALAVRVGGVRLIDNVIVHAAR